MTWATRFLFFVLGAPLLLGSALALAPAFTQTSLVANSTGQMGQLIPPAFLTLLSTPGIATSAITSLVSGLLTPAISLAIVFLFLAATQGNRIGNAIAKLSAPVLAIPHAAAAFALALLLAPSGVASRVIASLLGWDLPPDYLFINDPNGLALILGLVLKEAPFLLLISLAALPSLGAPRRVALARTLGYKPTTAWLLTVAPVLYPLVRLPLFAVIVFASSAVDVALILGPSLPPTLSVRLLEWFVAPEIESRQLASAAALLQLVVSLSALGIWLLFERVVARAFAPLGARGASRLSARRVTYDTALTALGNALLPLSLAFILMGIGALMLTSVGTEWRYPALVPSVWSTQQWTSALSEWRAPLFNATMIALLSVTAALALSLFTLEAQARSSVSTARIATFLYLPLLVPQVVFISGIAVLAERALLPPSLTLVAAGHFLFVLPYVYLTLQGGYARFDTRWLMLAKTLGASNTVCFWRIRLPLLSTQLVTAVMLGLAISLSLYLPTQILGAGRIPTLTTEAIALVSSGNRSTIGTWALLQSALPTLCFMLALVLPRLIWSRRKGML
jgi:putative thiamine transport system permease protein|tara:strand:- start:215 stop:1912 length:1698 start_codon:yes stop_codon:yes gene_type:complete